MTITSGAPISLGRRESGHRFIGHRPQHRRQVTPTGRVIASIGFLLSVVTHPFSRWTKALGNRNYRAWGIFIALLAWTGSTAGHLAGLGTAVAVLAAIDALTWGQALATFAPTDSCLEICIISISISVASLILIGMALVELHITDASLWVFVGIGALSLLLQVFGLWRQSVSEQKSNPIDDFIRQAETS